MRILSGFLKNRNIVIPKSSGIRPTSSKLRSAVFNICQGNLTDATVLDLFCGSGAMGIEAISRGASSCTFVDHDVTAILSLKKALSEFEIETQSTVIQKDAVKFLKYYRGNPFSLVYIDPPYALVNPINEILFLIQENHLLASGADIFLEVRKNSFTPSAGLVLSVISKRAYSDSDLWQFSTNIDCPST